MTYNGKTERTFTAGEIDLMHRIALLAHVCRRAQTTYFALRTTDNLIAAKNAEKALDNALAQFAQR